MENLTVSFRVVSRLDGVLLYYSLTGRVSLKYKNVTFSPVRLKNHVEMMRTIRLTGIYVSELRSTPEPWKVYEVNKDQLRALGFTQIPS